MEHRAACKKSVPRMQGTDSLSIMKKSMETDEPSGRETGRTILAISFAEPEKASVTVADTWRRAGCVGMWRIAAIASFGRAEMFAPQSRRHRKTEPLTLKSWKGREESLAMRCLRDEGEAREATARHGP